MDSSPFLNPSGNAPVPEGYTLITTERDFLQRAVTEPRLVVCGIRLCQWAKEFYKARGVECKTLTSVQEELLILCPEMDIVWANELFGILGERVHPLQRPLQVKSILSVLFPECPLQYEPSVSHAAKWAIWLDATQPNDVVLPLISHLVAEWQPTDEKLSTLYTVDSPLKAHTLLRAWLGLETMPDWNRLDLFPIDVPLRWKEHAKNVWTRRALNEGTLFFAEVFDLSLPLVLKRIAAQTLCDYMEANWEHLTRQNLLLLQGYLEEESLERLEALIPPPAPASPPKTIEEVSQWFVETYLPYRRWSLLYGDDTSRQGSDAVAQEFARWCLDFYPSALAGGEGAKHLAIYQGAHLRESRNEWVTLWVILDGLHYADATLLTKFIDEESRLTRALSQIVVSTLPTITVFCKNALIFGTPADALPKESTALPSDVKVISENKDATSALEGLSLGDIALWRISEPDKSYHKSQDSPTLLGNVEGELRTFANRLKTAVKRVDKSLPLRVIISTDHGRLIGASSRKHTVPVGMISEGRAAHGDVVHPTGSTNASGYNLNNEGIVFLDKTRFRLPETCGVVLDGTAFQMNDGSQGRVEFPHGGLFPEEVLTPWIEFVRDATLPQVEVEVSGQGVSGTPGVFYIVVSNPGYMTLKIRRFALRFGELENIVPLEGTVTGITKKTFEVEWAEWPNKTQAETAYGVLFWETLSGERRETPAKVSIESRELYTSNFAPEDLSNL